MSKGKKAKLIIGGFMAGFILGVVVTSLVTPWSGIEAQNKLGLRELPASKKLEKLKELVEEVEKELAENEGKGTGEESEA